MALMPLFRHVYRSHSHNHNSGLNNLLASGTQSVRNHSYHSMQGCHNLKCVPANLKPNVVQNAMCKLTAYEHWRSKSLPFQARFYNSLSEEMVVTVSLTQMKKVLRSHGVAFEDGFTCLIADCPLCVDNGKHSSKLYINKFTGFFQCHQCHNSGPWATLERYFTRKKMSKPLPQKELDKLKEGSLEEQEVITNWKKLKKITEALTTIPEEEVIAILNELNILESSKVIGHFDVRIDELRSALYFPLNSCDSQIVGYKILNIKTRQESTFPLMGCSGIISPKQGKTNKSETAVLVPSLLDTLSLATLKMNYQVICLPHGLTSLPQQVLPALERFGKLVLWFGDEIDSWDTARNFAKKLGEKRCHFVRPVDEQPSAHAALTGGRDMRAILAAAQPIWHEAITEFASLRQDVLAELQNNDKVQGVKWKRFPSLTRILKGHRRGEFTVLTGPTGSGKTTFMSEYSLDLALQGVNTLWGSFEIRNARLARTMLTQMAGLPLDKHLDQFDSFADQFEKLPIYFMTFHGQQSVKVVMEAVEHATYVHDIAHVIIDNVQFMMGVSEESKHMDRFWKQDAIIAHFRTFATKKNCHVSLVIHPRKERESEDLTTNSIFGGAKAAQEADNVLIIQDKRLTSVRGKKYLQIAKNRYSGDLGVMPLDFDKDSISYGNRKKKTADDGDLVS